MDFLGARIQLNPRPSVSRSATLEVGFLGHCPGRVDAQRFLALESMLNEIEKIGYGQRLKFIRQLASELISAEKNALPAREIDALNIQLTTAISHLPLPLHSSAEFDDIFPEARTESTIYGSLLAGNKAWLPQAVDDYFANAGEKLWLVRVPEEDGADGFLPSHTTASIEQDLLHPDSLRGLSCLLLIRKLALVAMPDLERLQIPANIPDVPRKRLANPEPVFLPLGTLLEDGHRERRNSSEIFAEFSTQPMLDLLRRTLLIANRIRPDLQFLLTLPLSYSNKLASPSIDYSVVNNVDNARKSSAAPLLRQVQLLFPYLRQGNRLFSGVGVIAGAISSRSAIQGAWRSIAMQPLISLAQPFPAVDTQMTISLRETPGVGVLTVKAGQLKLDDERLLVPALHANDYLIPGESGHYSDKLNGLRSAEVVRFIGYLIRELRELGEQLIFNVDPQDPRPQLVLERFFLDLYRAGALRGDSAQDAFQIQRTTAAENIIAFDIQIAPAYPIDKIMITFVNKNGEWQPGVSNG
jgi:hypothetical protein